MASNKKTSVAVDVVKNAPLKTKEYEKELRRLHVEPDSYTQIAV